jgi:hypothetical protein
MLRERAKETSLAGSRCRVDCRHKPGPVVGFIGFGPSLANWQDAYRQQPEMENPTTTSHPRFDADGTHGARFTGMFATCTQEGSLVSDDARTVPESTWPAAGGHQSGPVRDSTAQVAEMKWPVVRRCDRPAKPQRATAKAERKPRQSISRQEQKDCLSK